MRFVQRECIARVYFNNVPYWKGKFINMLHDIIRATDERKSVIFWATDLSCNDCCKIFAMQPSAGLSQHLAS